MRIYEWLVDWLYFNKTWTIFYLNCLEAFSNKNKPKLYLVIKSCTSFRVNPHPIFCLNVKELLARSRRHIWSLIDSNLIRTHNHLVRKWTRNHLAKLVEWLKHSDWTMYRTHKYSQHSSINWPVWLNGWLFLHELSRCGFESLCCYLNFRYGAFSKQGVPWHSGKI